MKAIIEGVEHHIIGEPTPSIIHGLYAPELAPPVILPDYPEQIDYLYRANGRRCATMIMAHPDMSVGQIIGLGRKDFVYTRLLEHGGVMGPFTLGEKEKRLAGLLGYRALGIWMPSQ